MKPQADHAAPSGETSPRSAAGWLRLVASQLPALMWTTDAELRFTSGGGAAIKELGLQPGELIGVSMYDYFRTSDEEFAPIRMHRRALAGERVSFDQEWSGKHFRAHLEPLRDDRGRIIGVIGVSLDVSEGKQLELELLAVRQRFEDLSTNLPGVLFQTRCQRDGSFLEIPYIGPQSQEYFGATPAEVMNDPSLLIQAMQPEDRARYYESALDATRNATPFRFEFRTIEELGGRWLHVCSQPRLIGDTQIQFSGVIIDITERKRAESEANRAKQSLAAFGHDLHRDLQATNQKLRAEVAQREQAEKSLRAEQDLLRNLLQIQDRDRQLTAYDIHDGLVQDMVGAKLMLEGALANGPTEENLTEVRDLLGKAVKEARRLIRDLRPLVIDEQGLAAAIRELVADAKAQAAAEIHFDCPHDLGRLSPLLEGVAFRIVQEALTNAVRHSRAHRIDIRLAVQDDQLVATVEDNGAGFESDRIPKDRFGVRGIHERARLMGGDAEIDARPGEGVKVTVRLPVKKAPFHLFRSSADQATHE